LIVTQNVQVSSRSWSREVGQGMTRMSAGRS
jgi:hypothetical protein